MTEPTSRAARPTRRRRRDWQPPTWDEIVAAALRPRLPARLPADRQPARRRGPHPGGLRPGVPVAVDATRPAPSRAGCTASPPTSSSTRPAASSGSASTRSPTTPPTGCPSREPTPDAGLRRQLLRRRRRRPRWTRCRRTSAPPSCSATSRACPTRRSPTTLGIKLGTVRSRIHRGRAQLRKALAHRAPAAGRSRYSGPRARRRPRLSAAEHVMPAHVAAGRSSRLLGQRPGRRPARRGDDRARLGPRPALPAVPPAGRARGLGEAAARRRSPGRHARSSRPTGSSARCSGSTPRSSTRSEAWAATDRLEDRSRTRRRAGIALVGAGSVSAAVLGLSTLTATPMGIGGSAGTPASSIGGAHQLAPPRPPRSSRPAASVHGRLPRLDPRHRRRRRRARPRRRRPALGTPLKLPRRLRDMPWRRPSHPGPVRLAVGDNG